MSQADKYRGRSLLPFAQATDYEAERARWVNMAQTWLQWAQEEEFVALAQ